MNASQVFEMRLNEGNDIVCIQKKKRNKHLALLKFHYPLKYDYLNAPMLILRFQVLLKELCIN